MDALNFSKVVPEWMNKAFFEKVVRQMEKDPKAVVEDLQVGEGSKPGENFGSSLYRAVITFKSKFTKDPKTISTIIKVKLTVPPEFADMQEFIDESPLFRNEMEMYGKVLPEIQSLWLSMGDNDMLCPKLIYQSTEPMPVIILEDMSGLGFSILEKNPKNFALSRMIFIRLAKFHAANFFLHSEQKLDYSEFTMNIFQNAKMVDMMCNQTLEGFIAAAKNWDGFATFIPHLESFKRNFLSRCLRSYTANRSDGGYNVLNHADFHRKNLLFQRNAYDAIKDFLFIDFQISIYATPAIDLIYALCFFVSPENREKHRDELIAIYHKQFVESLKQFGYLKAPPSLLDLQTELLRNGHLEVIIFLCLGIFFHSTYEEVAAAGINLAELGTVEGKTELFNMPGFQEIMSKELPRWLYKGFI